MTDRRPIVFSAGLLLGSLLIGCGEDPRTPDAEPAVSAYTERVSAGPSAPVTAAERDVEPGGAATPQAPQADPHAGRVARYHDAARTPFPEEGEALAEHLAFTRLSDHDAFANPIDPADIPALVPWEEASNYVGHTITVVGRIVDVGQTRTGSVNFLNFHPDWRNKFYLVVFDDLAKTLDTSVRDTFLNRTVHVRGLVEDHRGRPQLKIESMDQVEFVEE